MRTRTALALTVSLVACGPPARPIAGNAAPARTPVGAPAARAVAAPAPAVTQPPSATVAVLDPAELAFLEAAGFAFGAITVGNAGRTTHELSALPQLRGLFRTVQDDVRAAARPFPLARVTSIDGFRLFDARWLDSTNMTFTLVGVFNRLDRRPFYEDTCGEVRFIYRLGYTTEQGGAPMASRLPMTLNVVFLVDGEGDAGCRNAARSWQIPANLRGDARMSFLVEHGALDGQQRRRFRLKSIETNLQTFRLQSSVHPSLAGHIEYDLRVFHPTDPALSAFAPAPMENMPDVPALAKDTALRAELLGFLKKALPDVDRGTLQLPDRFLAKAATSYSPRGLTRVHNRPFRELFRPEDFAGIDLSGFRTIRSPAALLRRLDAASCVGCHQSRSIAGFHHVGRDPDGNPAFNALFSGSSPHLHADLERRRAYVDAVARGETAEEFRPLPELQGTAAADGAPCGLGDPGFATAGCAPGFRCTRLEDEELGACFAEETLGGPCEYGKMVPNARPWRDRIEGLERRACGPSQTCDTNFQGFPEGSCSASCRTKIDGSSCADFLDVDGFQNCLRSRGSFDGCARTFVFPARLASCDDEHACRQDYVCARTRDPGAGACVPPYFVFQLRLDGYPIRD